MKEPTLPLSVSNRTIAIFKLLVTPCLALAAIFGLHVGVSALQLSPLGEHCPPTGPGGGGERDPNFCGCTWGAAYASGHPLEGVTITLAYAGRTISYTTYDDTTTTDAFPTFHVRAAEISAVLGSRVLVTAELPDVVMTRTMLLLPNAHAREQALVFVKPAFLPDPNSPEMITATIAISAGALHFNALAGLDSASPARIVAYEWHSNRDGMFGTEPRFSAPVRLFSRGTHTVTVTGLDNFGRETEPLEFPINIANSVAFLPAVSR